MRNYCGNWVPLNLGPSAREVGGGGVESRCSWPFCDVHFKGWLDDRCCMQQWDPITGGFE